MLKLEFLSRFDGSQIHQYKFKVETFLLQREEKSTLCRNKRHYDWFSFFDNLSKPWYRIAGIMKSFLCSCGDLCLPRAALAGRRQQVRRNMSCFALPSLLPSAGLPAIQESTAVE